MRILGIPGLGLPDKLFCISKAGDSVDILEQAKVAAEEQLVAHQTETKVQPTSATPLVQDDEKKRRCPWIFRRRKQELNPPPVH